MVKIKENHPNASPIAKKVTFRNRKKIHELLYKKLYTLSGIEYIYIYVYQKHNHFTIFFITVISLPLTES